MENHFSSIQQEVCVHIKMDTGMHRLGFTPEDIDALISRLQRNPSLRVQSVFTHLASSEDPADDDFTHRQISRFDLMSNKLTKGIGYPVLRHVLNSAGISRFTGHQYEMVRLGIGLYGVGHDAVSQRNLRNVSTLRSVITQIKRVPAGDSVGYNRKGKVSRDSLIAVIPIGYADGFDRRLGNGCGVVYIGGHPAPVIGNVCMDLTMIDITGLPYSATIAEGTPVILFSDQHPVAEMASAMGTIPYEVLTGISRRVKRVYFYE
jgi:alanine racemase